jgi:hypothetical protein
MHFGFKGCQLFDQSDNLAIMAMSDRHPVSLVALIGPQTVESLRLELAWVDCNCNTRNLLHLLDTVSPFMTDAPNVDIYPPFLFKFVEVCEFDLKLVYTPVVVESSPLAGIWTVKVPPLLITNQRLPLPTLIERMCNTMHASLLEHKTDPTAETRDPVEESEATGKGGRLTKVLGILGRG